MDNPASVGSSKQELTLDQINFSKGRSKREKCLVGVSIVLFFLAIIFMILFIIFYLENEEKDKDKDKEPEKKEDICNSFDCLKLASTISDSLDPAVKPCDDFYQFACGKWIENTPIPPASTYWENFQAVTAELTLALRELLEMHDLTAADAIQKARAFYRSCVNTVPLGIFDFAAPDAPLTGTAPWLKLIGSGGANVFPTLEGSSWVDENWGFNDILARVPMRPDFTKPALLYYHPLLFFSVGPDSTKADRNILGFSQPYDFDLNRYQFLGDRNNAQLQERVLLYVTLAASLGANATLAYLDAQDVVDFEVRVAQATMPAPIDPKTNYNKTTIRQMSQRYPQFDWLRYAQEQMTKVGITLTMDEEVTTDALDYFDKIFDVISSTPKRTLLNYCWWIVIQAYAKFAPNSSRKKPQDVCATHTKFYFPEAVSRLYVDKHFSEHTRKKVEDMIVDLQDAFRSILQETEWMSEQTRQTAVEKVDAIIDKVGYSDDMKNDTYLDEKTKDMVIDETDVLASAMNVGEHVHESTLRRLRQRNNRQDWVTSSADVNAYYNPATNSIIFPAAFIQKPIYRDTVVKALSYGGLGFFIGHEITHGFDNKGGNFDKDGNLQDWWQEEDLQEFQRRGECMVEQYNQFRYPEVNMSVNGRLTLGENIGDNGGLKEAYLAYTKMVERTGKADPKLPVLPYTPEQLFFISTAQFWCIYRTPAVLQILLQDVHTPNKFRVIGLMQNSLEFAEAFKCPKGSYMNPEKKCHVW